MNSITNESILKTHDTAFNYLGKRKIFGKPVLTDWRK